MVKRSSRLIRSALNSDERSPSSNRLAVIGSCALARNEDHKCCGRLYWARTDEFRPFYLDCGRPISSRSLELQVRNLQFSPSILLD